jgi:hypothetical protein
MKAPFTLEYQTEGAPLLIADVPSFAHWTGTDDDGSGVVVDYVAANFERLPKEFKTTKSPGRQLKKFATAKEAEAFERKLLPVLIKLHPEVKDIPKYPDRSHSYIGESNPGPGGDPWDAERCFSMEREQGSMFRTHVLKKFDGAVKLVTFDKKKKAAGILLDQQGNHGGLIFANEGSLLLAIGDFTSEDVESGQAAKVKKLLPALLDRKARAKAKPKAFGKISFDGRIVIADSSLSHAQVAEENWKKKTFVDGVTAAFDKSKSGPLKYPAAKLPGGAFISSPAGAYELWFHPEVNVAGSSVQLLWLAHQ